MTRYVLHPRQVLSKNDRDWHFISASVLANLYGVALRDCVEVKPGFHDLPGDVHLYPDFTGDYRLPTPAEPTCGEKLGKGPAACMLARGHSGYHEYVPGRGTKRDPSVPVPNYRQASEADDVRTYRPGDPETPAEPGLGQWRPKYEDGP